MESIEETSRNNLFLIDNTANPAPLGLCAFGITTLALSLHNFGITELGSPILGLALFYGGIAQVIVGILEWKKNNTFGFCTFGSYGFFWLSFAAIVMLPALNISKTPGAAELAAFLGLWAIFSVGIFICTFKMHKTLNITLLLLVLAFVLLAAAEITGNALLLTLGGLDGLLTGALALYIGLAQVINDIYGELILPI